MFINQIRMKIGIVFGNPETTTGGNALKFYASIRLDVRRAGQLKDGDRVIGSHTKVRVVKNKVAPPFREAEFDILYGTGIAKVAEILDLAVARNLIEKAGASFSFEGERLGHGRERALEFLREHPAVVDSLLARLVAIPTGPLPADPLALAEAAKAS
jgi:recombination protein RecA